jgi:hypothetical protein
MSRWHLEWPQSTRATEPCADNFTRRPHHLRRLWSTHAPFTESLYVDGAGQLCTTTCTSPLPEWVIGIEPPF